MNLQTFLIERFRNWKPAKPELLHRTKYGITLSWDQKNEVFGFLGHQLLYRVEKKEKIPPWVVVYSGGKITKYIDNLAPSHPHKFRLQVQLKSTALSTLADKAIEFYGDSQTVYDTFILIEEKTQVKLKEIDSEGNTFCKETSENFEIEQPDGHHGDSKWKKADSEEFINTDEKGDHVLNETNIIEKRTLRLNQTGQVKPWLESQWSDEIWTSTDSEGATVICFCMAVKCGYLKQVQQMLEERPALIEIINSVNGLTPLITAVRKGDIATVRLLITSGANVNQKSAAGQTALQLAIYSRRLAIAELLIEKGAETQASDLNGLRVEHYAVDSGACDVTKFVFDRGGDLTVRDSNGWTPLFRAISQGASIELIEDLITRGADVNVVDQAGLTIADAARLLKDRRGNPRDSIIRLIDPRYPHEKAVTHFTRLTKKISSMQSVFK